jgi:hypothetical protein
VSRGELSLGNLVNLISQGVLSDFVVLTLKGNKATCYKALMSDNSESCELLLVYIKYNVL